MPTKVRSEFSLGSYNSATLSPQVTPLANNCFALAWLSLDTVLCRQIFDLETTSFGSQFCVNVTAVAYPTNIRIATLSNNNFVVVRDGVYAQLFDLTNTPVSGEFLVNTYTINTQHLPEVAGLTNGNFVVAWESLGQQGLYGQRFNAIATRLGSEFFIAGNLASLESVSALSNGGFVVTWQSYGQVAASTNSLYCKTDSSSEAFVYTSMSTNSKISSNVAGLTNGNFVIVWGSSIGVFGQLFNATAIPINSQFRADNSQFCAINTGGSSPRVSSLSNGNFVVAWQSNFQNSSNYVTCGRVFNLKGDPIGNNFQINTGYDPKVKMLANGNFAVIWTRPSSRDISGQIFYGNASLTIANLNQLLNYTEDKALSIPGIAVFSLGTNSTVRLTFSDPNAGQLIMPSVSGVNVTYTPSNGTWFASGGVNEMNDMLSNITFIPTPNYNRNISIAVMGNDDLGIPANGIITLMAIPVNDPPTLVNNQLNITEGQTVVLTSTNLSATETVDTGAAIQDLLFIVSQVQGGRFELVTNPSMAITSFTQQQIVDRQVQFVQDGAESASYQVSVSDGQFSTSPVAGNVTFAQVNDAPVLVTNQMVVTENQSPFILTSANLLATDADVNNPSGNLVFTLRNVKGGQFEFIGNLATAIFSFTQQELLDRKIRFAQNGAEGVSYEVSVSDGQTSTPFVSSNVTFVNVNDAPRVVQDIPNLSVNVNQPFNFSFKTKEIFEDADGDPLTFFAQSYDNTPLPNWIQFNASEQELLLTGNKPSAGTNRLSVFAIDNLNKSTHTDFDVTAVNENTVGNVNIFNTNTTQIVGAVVGGLVGLGVLIGAGLSFWRYATDKGSRQGEHFADYIREALNLKGVNNFETNETGQQYITFVRNLIQVLQQVGVDIKGMRAGELRELANDVAEAAQNKITPATDCLGRSEITVHDLTNKIQEIVIEIQVLRGGSAQGRNYTL